MSFLSLYRHSARLTHNLPYDVCFETDLARKARDDFFYAVGLSHSYPPLHNDATFVS